MPRKIQRTLVRLAIVLLSVPGIFARGAVSSPDNINAEVDAAARGRPLVHFWSVCVGAGRANEGLRATWQEQLKLVHDQCGFQYVRFHGLFHNDMFVYNRNTNGVVTYNWQYVDDLFDRMLAMGVRPFVELGFNPIDPMPNGWHGQFWWRANTSPPADDQKWADLVDHFARHCIERYGAGEVRQWYFEVWNEPNLDGFFHGGNRQKYFNLYKITALTLKNVDPRLRVGGPATSNFRVRLSPGASRATVSNDPTPDDVEALDWQPVWVTDFLAYCHSNSLPVDFVSTHPYPQDFPLDDLRTGKTERIRRGVNATKHDLTTLRKIVNASPYPRARIELTEWSSSPSSRDFTHDCLPAAAFIVKENIESAGLADSLSYWTFTDLFEEKGAGETIFHGGFGLVNYQGIVKPAFHAYRFLNALGDETIFQTNGVIVTRHRNTGKLTALVYDYPSEVRMSLPVSATLKDAESMLNRGEPANVRLLLTDLPPGAPVAVETLDRSHGNAVAASEAMGSPEPPTRQQAAELRQEAMATKKELFKCGQNGAFLFQRQIQPWSLVLITQK